MPRNTIILPKEEIIEKYNNWVGVETLAKEYHVGKLKIKAILDEAGVSTRGAGGRKPLDRESYKVKDFRKEKYKTEEGYHYIAVDRKSGKEIDDYMNAGGHLTSHIRKKYGVEIPTLYDRRKYYQETGNYWWEQWFDIVKVKDDAVKKCPYCDWATVDVENKSGAFEVHLRTAHNMSKTDYIKEHPEEREYFALVNPSLDIKMETDPEKFVICQLCGEKMGAINDSHLKRHHITKEKYIDLFGREGMISKTFHRRLSEIAVETNKNMKPVFVSKPEKEIGAFLAEHNIEYISGERKLLNGKELDIYVPECHLAIEYNGNLWHGEKNGKDPTSHVTKTNMCQERGIDLIQIFEDEYLNHRDIVYAKIANVLGLRKSLPRVPARKCAIEEISKKKAEVFLEKNHIQGSSKATVYLGALYEGHLVGVMTILQEDEGLWNLNRFATDNGYICQGLGGKMFSYFVRNYSPVEVKSFADRRWTTRPDDNLYTKLGFVFDGVVKPDYTYYHPREEKCLRHHKFNFRKEILHKKYGFPLSMTEKEMTQKLGYDRIWNCGLYRYVWRKEK